MFCRGPAAQGPAEPAATADAAAAGIANLAVCATAVRHVGDDGLALKIRAG